MADGDQLTVAESVDLLIDESEDQVEEEPDAIESQSDTNLVEESDPPARDSLKLPESNESLLLPVSSNIVSGGQISNLLDPDDAQSDHESQGSGGSSKGSLNSIKPEQADDYHYGDDEFSDGEESRLDLTQDQSQWLKDLDDIGRTFEEEEEEEEMDEQEEDEQEQEEEEDEIDEEEEEADYEDWRRRKKLYHFSKFKQDKLIVNYMQCIDKLKIVRKKNMYLQDRIYKHLREKEKVLNQCRESVKERKAKAIIQHQSDLDVKGNRKQDFDSDNEACDPTDQDENGVETTTQKKTQAGNLFETLIAKFNKEKKHQKKCKRLSKLKNGKGPSKTPRLAMKHYHTEALNSKKPKINHHTCEISQAKRKSLKVEEDSEEKLTNEQASRKTSGQHENELNSLYSIIQKSEVDELEDEWRYRHEKRRSRDIRKSRAAKKSLRKSRLSGGPEGLNGLLSSATKSHPEHSEHHHEHGEHAGHEHEDFREIRKKRRSQKRNCHEKIRRKKSIMNKKLLELQRAQELSVEVEKEEEEEVKDHEEALPEFKYEFSDLSLTKMKYGTKMRQELEKVIITTKLPIHLQWPLTVKGFEDYFKRKNPYGKVIYTMRLESQVRQARKISRKYKYVMHNYNYQIQQYNVLNEIHESNMKYLEISKQKWEFLVEDLFARVIQEMRDYSDMAVDSSGKRIPSDQVDRFCREIGKEFETFQYTARIFYRVLHNVGVAIRHLCYSESHGEGVELFEFKHLLRANETIGAQHVQKLETVKSYKQRAKRFVNNYQKHLTQKDDIEITVTDKFRLSGEISCMMEPKQIAVKSFEATAKKALKKESVLRRKAGIVPYRHLVVDYEDTFMTIAEKRQVRRDYQLKYNSRVREVHQIFDKMDEIERKMPELFMEPPLNPLELDACGYPVQDSRPKTAPPSSSSLRKLPSIKLSVTEPLPFLVESKSRSSLETPASRPKTAAPSFGSLRPKTATPSFRSVDRKLSEPTTRTQTSHEKMSSLPPIRPSTAIPQTSQSQKKLSLQMEDKPPIPVTATNTRRSFHQLRPSTAAAGEKRSSTGGDKRPSQDKDRRQSESEKRASAMAENLRNSVYLAKIAEEQAENTATAKRKTLPTTTQTAAKTGIVPMITKKNMLTIAKGSHGKKNYPPYLHHKNTSIRPSTAPITSYESEVKHWPYQYYTKPSPQLENTSKRRMDVVLGSLVHQPRPVSLG